MLMKWKYAKLSSLQKILVRKGPQTLHEVTLSKFQQEKMHLRQDGFISLETLYKEHGPPRLHT